MMKSGTDIAALPEGLDEDVLRLEVAVYEVQGMHERQALQHLHGDFTFVYLLCIGPVQASEE